MPDKMNDNKPSEEKISETEFQDSFAGFFSEEEEAKVSQKNKKHRRKNKEEKGPDILAVSEECDPGFVIKEVVALDVGNEVLPKKEEPNTVKEETEYEEAENESTGAQAENGTEECDAQTEEVTEKEEESTEEAFAEETHTEEKEKKKKSLFSKMKAEITQKRKRQYAATIGAVLVAFAIIGAIAVCTTLVKLGIRVLDNMNQKEAFAWKIYPVLMFDPSTFEDPTQLDEVFLLKTSLWATLFENRTKYFYDDTGMLLVPASDLDVAAKSLYGDGITLKHQTFAEGYDYFYIYDEKTNTYSVPVAGQTAGYAPKVVDINKNGDVYTLIVGYVAPTTLWNVNEKGAEGSVPDKYLYYDLLKLNYNEYVIKSVRNIPEDELPDNLEVSDMQELNQTQYIDYDDKYQEQFGQNPQEDDTAGESSDTSSEESDNSSSEESSDSSSEESSESSSSQQ